jgi:trimethylamine--corrinoid protein Co-methyltransferase
MDNEIARYVRRALTGFEVNDETLCLELVKSVGAGGNYLLAPDTESRFRDLLVLSPFFRVDPWGPGIRADEARDWRNMANQRAEELIGNEVPSPLSREQIREIDRIVGEAEAKAADAS